MVQFSKITNKRTTLPKIFDFLPYFLVKTKNPLLEKEEDFFILSL
jgi:hypothetical protein